jgi:GAF domain-containing protein
MARPRDSVRGMDEKAQQQEKSRALVEGQSRILALIDADKPLAETLAAICRLIEAQSDGLLCSVLLLDEEGQHLLHGAAPSLPAEYCEAVNGISIGQGIGSCGTAAFTGQPCLVEDLSVHPNWVGFRDLAFVKHGLRACWSTPIRSYEGRVVATFAMYYRSPRMPMLEERKLIDFTSHLVSIAINRHRERIELEHH